MSERLYLKKLRSSGLDEQDAELLGFKLLDVEQVKALCVYYVKEPCLYIPYYDPETNKPYRCKEGTDKECDFFRVRLLTDKDKKQSVLEKAAPSDPAPPYRQLSSTGNYIYYPRTIELHGTQWATIIKDPSKPIIITEGELKAAKTCKVGFPCIAVAGVYNWTSKKTGESLVPSLKQINFKNRQVQIVFDSDMADNKDIKRAMLALANKITHLGAKVYCASVPSRNKEKKTGLDDYFVYYEPADNEVLLRNLTQEILQKSELFSSYKALSEYNKEFVYVRKLKAYYNRTDDELITRDQFIGMHENQFLLKKYIDKQGDEKVKEVNSAKEWLVWGHRKQVNCLAYEPGRLKFINLEQEHGQTLRAYNTWKGWNIKPVEGDCDIFISLVKYICSASESGTWKWLMQWLAYPIQHAGAKLSTGVMLFGKQGTGKGSICRVMSRIYGTHYRQLDNNAFNERYTDWGDKRSFLFADDIKAANTSQLMSQLKFWITEPVFPVRPMRHSTYYINNHLNIIFATNEQDAIRLDKDDRRFTIIRTPPFKQPKEFYDRFYDFLNDENGAAKVMHYLLNLDLTGFDPHEEALKSDAKDSMIASTSSDLSRFIRDFLDNEDNQCDFVTAQDILNRYRQDPLATTAARAKVNINSVTKEFENSRYLSLFDGKRYHFKRGKRTKFYAARNQQAWFTRSDEEKKEHIQKYYKEIEVVSYNDSQNAQDIQETDDF